ncbi:MAG: hypothetical protein J6D47_14125 [Peptostreptococcaceae bacterium]|nr:hypothetical protein [Peptostreptococcaceae bacterium]
MAGWIKLHRDIQEHWLWEDEPFSRGQAFIDLLMEVNHEDKKKLFNGELIEIKRGSKITSLRQLSERWKWSTKKVKKFLEQLEKDEMITFKSDTKKTLITIENYSVYQDRGNSEETDKKYLGNIEENQKKNKGNSEENQRKTNKNDKEYIKNVKEGEEGKEEVPSLPPLFFSTPIHKKIYDQFGEVGYRTFFMEAEIKELDKEIIITHQDSFIESMILDRWTGKLKFLLGKKITVGED